jgi:hypothetical protein
MLGKVLSLLPERLAVCWVPPESEYPQWVMGEGLLSITRTADELSVICEEKFVPEDVISEHGWRALKIQGPLNFSLVGVLAPIAKILADNGVSIFSISTYETDYILVKEGTLENVIGVLRQSGYEILDNDNLSE